MTREAALRGHPTDEALAAWVDAQIGGEPPVEAARGVAAHLADCTACRARMTALESVIAAVRAEPTVPDREELGARKARVLAAIAPPARTQVSRIHARVWWWVPALAAAALAALLLTRAGDEGGRPAETARRPAAEQPAAEGVPEPLPVVVAAHEAAEEAAAAIAEAPTAPESVEIPTSDQISTDLAATAGTTLGDLAVLDEFASLSAEEQERVLDELATMEFDL